MGDSHLPKRSPDKNQKAGHDKRHLSPTMSETASINSNVLKHDQRHLNVIWRFPTTIIIIQEDLANVFSLTQFQDMIFENTRLCKHDSSRDYEIRRF